MGNHPDWNRSDFVRDMAIDPIIVRAFSMFIVCALNISSGLQVISRLDMIVLIKRKLSNSVVFCNHIRSKSFEIFWPKYGLVLTISGWFLTVGPW